MKNNSEKTKLNNKKTYNSHPFNEGKNPNYHFQRKGTFERESKIIENLIWAFVGLPVFGFTIYVIISSWFL